MRVTVMLAGRRAARREPGKSCGRHGSASTGPSQPSGTSGERTRLVPAGKPRFLLSPLAGPWPGEAPVPTEVAAAPHSPFGCVHLTAEVAAAQASLAVYVKFLSRQSRAAPHAPRGSLCDVPVTTEPRSPTRALAFLSPSALPSAGAAPLPSATLRGLRPGQRAAAAVHSRPGGRESGHPTCGPLPRRSGSARPATRGLHHPPPRRPPPPPLSRGRAAALRRTAPQRRGAWHRFAPPPPIGRPISGVHMPRRRVGPPAAQLP